MGSPVPGSTLRVASGADRRSATSTVFKTKPPSLALPDATKGWVARSSSGASIGAKSGARFSLVEGSGAVEATRVLARGGCQFVAGSCPLGEASRIAQRCRCDRVEPQLEVNSADGAKRRHRGRLARLSLLKRGSSSAANAPHQFPQLVFAKTASRWTAHIGRTRSTWLPVSATQSSCTLTSREPGFGIVTS